MEGQTYQFGSPCMTPKRLSLSTQVHSFPAWPHCFIAFCPIQLCYIHLSFFFPSLFLGLCLCSPCVPSHSLCVTCVPPTLSGMHCISPTLSLSSWRHVIEMIRQMKTWQMVRWYLCFIIILHSLFLPLSLKLGVNPTDHNRLLRHTANGSTELCFIIIIIMDLKPCLPHTPWH